MQALTGHGMQRAGLTRPLLPAFGRAPSAHVSPTDSLFPVPCSALIYDCGSRIRTWGVPRAQWMGVEFIRFALTRCEQCWAAGLRLFSFRRLKHSSSVPAVFPQSSRINMQTCKAICIHSAWQAVARRGGSSAVWRPCARLQLRTQLPTNHRGPQAVNRAAAQVRLQVVIASLHWQPAFHATPVHAKMHKTTLKHAPGHPLPAGTT